MDALEKCRICAATTDQKLNIFSATGQEYNLSEKIKNFIHVEVTPVDPYSKLICVPCLFKLQYIIRFCENGRKMQKLLLSEINQTVVDSAPTNKEEEIDCAAIDNEINLDVDFARSVIIREFGGSSETLNKSSVNVAGVEECDSMVQEINSRLGIFSSILNPFERVSSRHLRSVESEQQLSLLPLSTLEENKKPEQRKKLESESCTLTNTLKIIPPARSISNTILNRNFMISNVEHQILKNVSKQSNNILHIKNSVAMLQNNHMKINIPNFEPSAINLLPAYWRDVYQSSLSKKSDTQVYNLEFQVLDKDIQSSKLKPIVINPITACKNNSNQSLVSDQIDRALDLNLGISKLQSLDNETESPVSKSNATNSISSIHIGINQGSIVVSISENIASLSDPQLANDKTECSKREPLSVNSTSMDQKGLNQSIVSIHADIEPNANIPLFYVQNIPKQSSVPNHETAIIGTDTLSRESQMFNSSNEISGVKTVVINLVPKNVEGVNQVIVSEHEDKPASVLINKGGIDQDIVKISDNTSECQMADIEMHRFELKRPANNSVSINQKAINQDAVLQSPRGIYCTNSSIQLLNKEIECSKVTSPAKDSVPVNRTGDNQDEAVKHKDTPVEIVDTNTSYQLHDIKTECSDLTPSASNSVPINGTGDNQDEKVKQKDAPVEIVKTNTSYGLHNIKTECSDLTLSASNSVPINGTGDNQDEKGKQKDTPVEMVDTNTSYQLHDIKTECSDLTPSASNSASINRTGDNQDIDTPVEIVDTNTSYQLHDIKTECSDLTQSASNSVSINRTGDNQDKDTPVEIVDTNTSYQLHDIKTECSDLTQSASNSASINRTGDNQDKDTPVEIVDTNTSYQLHDIKTECSDLTPSASNSVPMNRTAVDHGASFKSIATPGKICDTKINLQLLTSPVLCSELTLVKNSTVSNQDVNQGTVFKPKAEVYNTNSEYQSLDVGITCTEVIQVKDLIPMNQECVSLDKVVRKRDNNSKHQMLDIGAEFCAKVEGKGYESVTRKKCNTNSKHKGKNSGRFEVESVQEKSARSKKQSPVLKNNGQTSAQYTSKNLRSGNENLSPQSKKHMLRRKDCIKLVGRNKSSQAYSEDVSLVSEKAESRKIRHTTLLTKMKLPKTKNNKRTLNDNKLNVQKALLVNATTRRNNNFTRIKKVDPIKIKSSKTETIDLKNVNIKISDNHPSEVESIITNKSNICDSTHAKVRPKRSSVLVRKCSKKQSPTKSTNVLNSVASKSKILNVIELPTTTLLTLRKRPENRSLSTESMLKENTRTQRILKDSKSTECQQNNLISCEVQNTNQNVGVDISLLNLNTSQKSQVIDDDLKKVKGKLLGVQNMKRVSKVSRGSQKQIPRDTSSQGIAISSKSKKYEHQTVNFAEVEKAKRKLKNVNTKIEKQNTGQQLHAINEDIGNVNSTQDGLQSIKRGLKVSRESQKQISRGTRAQKIAISSKSKKNEQQTINIAQVENAKRKLNDINTKIQEQNTVQQLHAINKDTLRLKSAQNAVQRVKRAKIKSIETLGQNVSKTLRSKKSHLPDCGSDANIVQSRELKLLKIDNGAGKDIFVPKKSRHCINLNVDPSVGYVQSDKSVISKKDKIKQKIDYKDQNSPNYPNIGLRKRKCNSESKTLKTKQVKGVVMNSTKRLRLDSGDKKNLIHKCQKDSTRISSEQKNIKRSTHSLNDRARKRLKTDTSDAYCLRAVRSKEKQLSINSAEISKYRKQFIVSNNFDSKEIKGLYIDMKS